MARKVFISFLGSSFYGSGKYAYGDFTSSETRFVQQATLEWINAKENEFPDIALILLTKGERGSKSLNWDKTISERENFQTKQKVEYFGLEKILSVIHAKLLPTEIPDGKDEKEIWEIFETIFEQIQDDDELYFDLTHGFRYLPMLLLVLGNYAKFLKKNIQIKHISYGNYEARNGNIAPFVDLLPLVTLQNWTSAANEFINFGNADRLQLLTKSKITPILKETRGQDEIASNLKKVNDSIYELSWDIKTNRGKKLIEGKSATNINTLLSGLQQNIIAPLNPVLDKIKESVDTFKGENDVENMLSAVQWCIDKQLIQEGFTLLQEGILSLFVKDDYANKNKRNFVSGFLNQYKSGKFDNSKFDLSNAEIAFLENLLKSYDKIAEWADIFSQLTERRNDINHAGICQNSMKSSGFKDTLIDLYAKVNQNNQTLNSNNYTLNSNNYTLNSNNYTLNSNNYTLNSNNYTLNSNNYTLNSNNSTTEKAIICDLDGTLAIIGNRDPYDASKCDKDELNKPVAEVINLFHAQGYKILLVSGREDKFREPTESFLTKFDIPYQELWMRKTNDTRKDAIVKKEIYEKEIAEKYYIEFVIDDRNQVVDMWRKELNLTCFQVNYGDF